MKAIIVGGGIGGLTAALCLHHHGIEIEVHEQAAEIKEVGAGIQISPNAMKVFAELGIDQALERVAFCPQAIVMRMGESGMRLIRTPLSGTIEHRTGSPYLHVHRADLIAALRDAVDDRIPGALKLGSVISGYSQTGASVQGQCSKGGTIDGDILIGADGIHSSIREYMHGPDEPAFTGNVAWRAVVPIERLGANAPEPVASIWMGRGKHAVTYLLRRGTLANLIAVVERNDWSKESWTERGHKDNALADFAGWHPSVTTILQKSEKLFRWALFDRAPLQSWVEGRVALMGDAAHPMLPFMAQGAAMAIEDAWALAAKVAQSADVQTGLANYQSLRFDRATAVQTKSRANAKTFHQSSVAGRIRNYGPIWLAGRLAPKIGLQRQDWVYKYNIVQAAS